MNETRDPDISRLYRDASAEVPPAALGRALSAAATAAAPADAPVAVSRAQRKWGAPLALAASVVLGLGIVLRVAVERPDMRPAAEEPAVASVPQMPATGKLEQQKAKAAADNAADSGSQTGGTSDPAKQRLPRDIREKAAETAAAPAAVEREEIAAMKRSAAPAVQPTRPEMAEPPVTPGKASGSADVAPARPAAAMAAPPEAFPAPAAAVPAPAATPAPAPLPPPSAKAAPMAAASAPEPARAARDVGAAVQGAAPSPPAAPAMAERRAAGVSADAARLRAEPGAVDLAQRLIAEEKTLLPADWIKRIIDMRRAGRAEEAEASLRRFAERYPGYTVPDAARGP
jgi:hypothetical protein